jgi:hypothetical protein
MKTSDSIKAIAQALSKAQGQMVSAAFDRIGGYKNDYASLASYIDATREALSVHGLSVTQTHSIIEGRTMLHTRLMHGESGEWIEGDILLAPSRADMPALMGANTYARRMGLGSILNVFQDEAGIEELKDTDDDGQTAADPGPKPEPAKGAQPKPKPQPKPSPPLKPVTPVAPIKAILARDKIVARFALKFDVSKADIEDRYQKDIDRLTQEEVNELVEIGKALAEDKSKRDEFFTKPPTPMIRNQRLRDLVSSIPEQVQGDEPPQYDFEFAPPRKDDST